MIGRLFTAGDTQGAGYNKTNDLIKFLLGKRQTITVIML